MEEKQTSSTGLDENVAGFLCYLFGFITGIVFLAVEKKSRFVKFHAMQSTITFLSLFVITIIIGWIPIIGLIGISHLDLKSHPVAHPDDQSSSWRAIFIAHCGEHGRGKIS